MSVNPAPRFLVLSCCALQLAEQLDSMRDDMLQRLEPMLEAAGDAAEGMSMLLDPAKQMELLDEALAEPRVRAEGSLSHSACCELVLHSANIMWYEVAYHMMFALCVWCCNGDAAPCLQCGCFALSRLWAHALPPHS